MKIKEQEEANWQGISALSDSDRSSLLCYLTGWLRSNAEFQEAVACGLTRIRMRKDSTNEGTQRTSDQLR